MSGYEESAAWLRRAQTDLQAFVEALAERLEGDMPGLVEVERKREGLFSGKRQVVEMRIHVDGYDYILSREGARVLTRRSQVVRGVVLRHEDLPLQDWLQGLIEDVGKLSGQMQSVSQALHDFLLQ
ncbi:MAG: hypothetical protein ACP5GA_01110 [Acidithiobacillus sp.]